MGRNFYIDDIDNELQKVEENLLLTMKSKNEILQSEGKRLIEAGGKRLRPAILIASAKFGDYNQEKVVDLASSIEILHLATLVHDDVIDESKMRRGVEAVQNKHGNKVAVFTGDFLFTKSFLILAKYNEGNNLEYLAKGIKNICEGEVEQFVTRHDLNVSVYKYLKRIKFKTALLFALACQIGAEAAKCDNKTVKALRNYGMALGTAFQIKDDILDFKGKKSKLGKPTGNDIKVGVYTLPIIHALNNRQYGDKLHGILSKPLSDETIEEVFHIVEKSRGIEYSIKMNERYIKKAKKWISKVPNNDYSQFLYNLAHKLDSREV